MAAMSAKPLAAAAIAQLEADGVAYQAFDFITRAFSPSRIS